MENKLKRLFDYQKFEKNANLEHVIQDSVERSSRMLSDDDLEMVAAAGIGRMDNVFEGSKDDQFKG